LRGRNDKEGLWGGEQVASCRVVRTHRAASGKEGILYWSIGDLRKMSQFFGFINDL
jgi:hypothetical protein